MTAARDRPEVYLTPRAARRLGRRTDQQGRRREELAAALEDPSDEVLVRLPDRPPWMRLSLSDRYVLLRPYRDGYLVADVVTQRDLDRAVKSLP